MFNASEAGVRVADTANAVGSGSAGFGAGVSVSWHYRWAADAIYATATTDSVVGNVSYTGM